MRLHRHRKKSERLLCTAEVLTMYFSIFYCREHNLPMDPGCRALRFTTVLATVVAKLNVTKATFPRGWSQPMNKCIRDTKAGLFLGDAWSLTGDCLKDSPLAWSKLKLYHNLRSYFPPPLSSSRGSDLHCQPMASLISSDTHHCPSQVFSLINLLHI